MFNFSEKRVVLTGATGGIGQAIARQFVQNGAHILISGTRINALNDLRDQLQRITQQGSEQKICTFSKHLNTSLDAQSLIDDAILNFGGIDILVHNAGITRDALTIRLKDSDWNDVINTNLSSAFFLSRAAFKPMMKQRFGRIIHISSVVGFTGNIGQSAYTASKSGLIGLTKTLALEGAPRHIHVNAIAPGYIETPMTDALSDDIKKEVKNKIPLQRMGTPHDIASGVSFLASDYASYITGQTLHINGGMALF